MENNYDNVCCKHCDSKNVEIKNGTTMVYAECKDCGNTTLLKSKETNIEKPISCPYCHSINTHKITTTSKVVNTAMFGVFGTKRFKNFHCNNCKSDF